MSKGPEYTFLQKPPSIEERFEVAKEFWSQAVADGTVSESDFEAQFSNPELTDEGLFNIARELQAGREVKVSSDSL